MSVEREKPKHLAQTPPGAKTARRRATWPRRSENYCAIQHRDFRACHRRTCGGAFRVHNGIRPDNRNRVRENYGRRPASARRLIDRSPGIGLAAGVLGCLPPRQTPPLSGASNSGWPCHLENVLSTRNSAAHCNCLPAVVGRENSRCLIRQFDGQQSFVELRLCTARDRSHLHLPSCPQWCRPGPRYLLLSSRDRGSVANSHRLPRVLSVGFSTHPTNKSRFVPFQ
jgi:hypothetical protein